MNDATNDHTNDSTDDSTRKRIRMFVIIAVVVGLTVAFLASAFGGGNSPEGYLRDNYDYVGGDPDSSDGMVFHSEADADSTAAAIDQGTDADDTREEDGVQYLRYDSDWMITVEDSSSGSDITLYDFDKGYDRHSSTVMFWGTYYNRDSGGLFRGGGSGSGK